MNFTASFFLMKKTRTAIHQAQAALRVASAALQMDDSAGQDSVGEELAPFVKRFRAGLSKAEDGLAQVRKAYALLLHLDIEPDTRKLAERNSSTYESLASRLQLLREDEDIVQETEQKARTNRTKPATDPLD